MKMIGRIVSIALIWMGFFTSSWAQEIGHEEMESRHSLAITINHAHTFQGVNAQGKRQVLILPMWGLDYNYRLSEKWWLGLHTDIIVETFEVEAFDNEGEETIRRTRPIAPALMGFYTLNEHWKLGGGAGLEWSEEETFTLNRLAMEYAYPLSQGWELIGAVQYDLRWNAYDTWSLGLGVLMEL